VKVDAVAIAAALANPWVHVVLSGATTVEQLSSNLEALLVNLPATELEALETLTEPPRDYWLQRQSIPWR
jgi:aryl-alcohol dehydrogenase-like predicted oxidoreductase